MSLVDIISRNIIRICIAVFGLACNQTNYGAKKSEIHEKAISAQQYFEKVDELLSRSDKHPIIELSNFLTG